MFRLLTPKSLALSLIMGKVLLVSALFLVASGQSMAMDNSETVEQTQNELLQRLVIEQGQGEFVQQKHF